MNDEPTYSIDEFERESRYIENLIWDALCIEKGERVLFCGFGPDGTRIKRAVDAGAKGFVIEHRDDIIREFESLGAELVRGSTSVIPAKADTYDIAISFHYLHEVDPFFHAQVVSELARVGKRVAIVEPAPPADPLGRRIALLYSQAKRELGQFEYYQPMDYWKKLLQAVKVEISQSVFAFAKVPPREYLEDTVELILDTMEVEEVPRAYMEELRAIAKRPSAQLLPPARFVLMGASVGELPQPRHTQREAPKRPPSQLAIAAAFDKKRDIETAPPPAVYSAQGVQPEYPPPPPPPPQQAAPAQTFTPAPVDPQPAAPMTFGVPLPPQAQPQAPPPT
ncbi:MAG: hypothetical protein M3N19_10690, partial [Candidatus Eremiobacteraeota bacterium]|nr:hypothetical protein [Candidatus Eremiobacteraeota bacterium]